MAKSSWHCLCYWRGFPDIFPYTYYKIITSQVKTEKNLVPCKRQKSTLCLLCLFDRDLFAYFEWVLVAFLFVLSFRHFYSFSLIYAYNRNALSTHHGLNMLAEHQFSRKNSPWQSIPVLRQEHSRAEHTKINSLFGIMLILLLRYENECDFSHLNIALE